MTYIVADNWPCNPGPKIGEESTPRFGFLKQGVFHSVYMEDKSEPPKPNAFRAIGCQHLETGKFVRVDASEGSGWMSDSYAGTVCLHCGQITHEKRVY